MKNEFWRLIIGTGCTTLIYFSSLISPQKFLNYPSFNNEVVIVKTSHTQIISNNGQPTKPNSTIDFKLEHCLCKRTIQKNTKFKMTDLSKTTCGNDAFQRGPKQKVVSFSFYGNIESKAHLKRKYFSGIEENLKAIQALYGQDWTMRLYIDLEKDDPLLSKLCQIACDNPNIDLCLTGALPGTPVRDARNIFPMLWRFFPTLDPQVDIILSRDLDSLIGEREVSAVKEWLKSGKQIHSMRDHPEHNKPLMGGLWGARLSMKKTRIQWEESWKKILNNKLAFSSRKIKGPDQTLLRAVWEWGKHSSLEHDSYNCGKFPNSVGFPTKRKRENMVNFVGGRSFDGLNKIQCPLSCRRKGHKDWNYC